MRRAPLAVAFAVAVALIAGHSIARRLEGQASKGPRSGKQTSLSSTPWGAATPLALEPVYVADTWQQAARAIDDTTTLATNRALIALARRYLGRPYNAYSLDRSPQERLQLDLTRFDCFLFVEQLLALVNSRRVDTQTDGVNRFTDHVRQLRYDDGQVDFCHRHHYFSRWAEAAEQQGYLVNITRFLPGAESRQRALSFMSSNVASYEPMQKASNRRCITELEQNLEITQPYIPLSRLQEALPSLRDGDLFGLVTQMDGLDVTHVGMVELGPSTVGAIHAAPAMGVTRSLDLPAYAANVEDVIGVMVLRPIPNPDGTLAKPSES